MTTADNRRTPSTQSGDALGVDCPARGRMTTEATLRSDHGAATNSSGIYGDATPTEFSTRIRAAIDSNLGLPPVKKPCPVPMVDAALFGEDISRGQAKACALQQANNVLPPRRLADELVRSYWQRMEPLDPLLDRKRFWDAYETLFTGREQVVDEKIFVSTLNVIFALSTQLQESVLTEQRESASKTYFHRAWSLLNPEALLWEEGSLELAQCLLLVARYLQNTTNVYQTRMTITLAIQITQSVETSNYLHGHVTRLKRRIWQCCVSMDR